MINNPVRFFINGSETRSFTYEGGSRLFHWSPYENGLSKSMECNIIFFANDENHAREVLRRMFEFWIECNNLYLESEHGTDNYSGLSDYRATETKRLKSYLRNIDKTKVQPAPVDQIFEVGWACNDNLHV